MNTGKQVIGSKRGLMEVKMQIIEFQNRMDDSMSSQEAIREEKELNLEEAFEMLEETVADLEREDISLEDSFLVYQKGMELLKKCNQAIDRIEKKVLVLEEDGETHEF